MDREVAVDALCMCREFETPESGWKRKLNPSECKKHGFYKRWHIVADISGLTYYENHEIVRPGGLHAIIFESEDKDIITIAFRHQEGEQLWHNDQLESMGLYGRNFIQQNLPVPAAAAASSGSILSMVAKAVQFSIHFIRRGLYMDYFTQSQYILQTVLAHYADAGTGKPIVRFTGYSLGGGIAQLSSIMLNAPAIVFASVGVQDVMEQLYSQYAPKIIKQEPFMIWNIFHPQDSVPALDCQYGQMCMIENASITASNAHEDLVYGSLGWTFLQQTNDLKRTCKDANHWNREVGVCESQQEQGNCWITTTFILFLFLFLIAGVSMWRWQRVVRSQPKKYD